MELAALIAECTAYDFKQMLEEKKPKSWLKSVSAFANGLGGSLFFGIDNDGAIRGLDDVLHVCETIIHSSRQNKRLFYYVVTLLSGGAVPLTAQPCSPKSRLQRYDKKSESLGDSDFFLWFLGVLIERSYYLLVWDVLQRVSIVVDLQGAIALVGHHLLLGQEQILAHTGHVDAQLQLEHQFADVLLLHLGH